MIAGVSVRWDGVIIAAGLHEELQTFQFMDLGLWP